MNEKRRKLLDSYAVLAWLQGERGGGRVKDLLLQARDLEQEDWLLINLINLGEVYYKLDRRHGRERTLTFRTEFLLLPIKMVGVDEELLFQASLIKADFPISYADAFAVATAIKLNAILLTGDQEFKKVEKLISIEWL